jgi:hypothetical protein
LGFLDFLENIGGRSGGLVSMFTDWKVAIFFVLMAFLAFLVFIVVPTVMWLMRHWH